MRIGILIAVEFAAFERKYGEQVETYRHGAFIVKKYNLYNQDIFVIQSKAGQIRASSAVTILLETYGCDIILNYGLVGALRKESGVNDLALIDKVVHIEFDTSDVDATKPGQYLEYDSIYFDTSDDLIKIAKSVRPDLPTLKLASGDKFIAGRDKKYAIAEEFDCDLVDMEGAAIALISTIYGKKYLMLKCVSDAINDGGEEFMKSFDKASDKAVEIFDEIIRAIIENVK